MILLFLYSLMSGSSGADGGDSADYDIVSYRANLSRELESSNIHGNCTSAAPRPAFSPECAPAAGESIA